MGKRIIRFPRCPNCKRRPWFGTDVYRCPACFTLFCDSCMKRGLIRAYCPRCGALLDRQDKVGYT